MNCRRILGILRILKRFCTQYRFQIANSADALFQHVSRHWNWGRYKISIWFRNFSVSSVFIRTNPYLNSAHGKGSAFPANLLYGWVRIGTESRGNQYGRTRSADNVFLRPESLLPNNTDRILQHCDFPCFYVAFSLFSLHFLFFRLYFHGADN